MSKPNQQERVWLERLLDNGSLNEAEAGGLMEALTDESLPPPLAGALLAALRAKGETAEEIRGFAQTMRRLARSPQLPVDGPLIDIVGTGGDGSGSLNISTGTALLVAACGLPVVKHGNRSVSSKSGSADVLETLGLPMPLSTEDAAECLVRTGFTFLFAPHYHPAMKAIAPIRGALGVRTVFNLLGPLTNPAQPPFHLLGAFSQEAAELMAHTIAGMKLTRAFVVHGEPGWDEATPVGKFVLYDVRPETVQKTVRDPLDYGLARCTPAELAGGDAKFNAAALREVLTGEDQGPHRDALLLGAALALELTGMSDTPDAALALAREAIDTGRAAGLLQRVSDFGALIQ